MFKFILAGAAICAVAVSGCASSSVTQLAKNRAIVSTSAAPVCRTSGAASVANQMAAITTLRQGYERFIVVGFGTENNTRVVSTGPTFATTTGSFNQYGGTVYGSSRTTYGGQSTSISGSNDAEIEVVMLNPGDAGYAEGLDAKAALGPDWQKKVEDGVPNCF